MSLPSSRERGGGGGRGRGPGGRGGAHRGGSHPPSHKRPFSNLLSQTSSSDRSYSYHAKLPSSSSPPSSLPLKRPRPSPSSSSPSPSRPLLVSDVLSDSLTPIANSYWAPGQPTHLPFDASLIPSLYTSHLTPPSPLTPPPSLSLLDLSGYLENYLYPHLTPTSPPPHLLSILLLINQKFRASLPHPFDPLTASPTTFPLLIHRLLSLRRQVQLTVYEVTEYVHFWVHLFGSLEVEAVRRWALRLVGLVGWRAVSRARRERELRGRPELRQLWAKVVRQCVDGRTGEECDGAPSLDLVSSFIPRLISEFIDSLYSLPSTPPTPPSDVYQGKVVYCERFLELCIDLLSQLPTRRFFHTLISDCHLLALCRLSPLASEEGAAGPRSLFCRLLDLLQSYHEFDIDDHTGDPIPPDVVLSTYHQRIAHLQRVVFREFPELKGMALVNVASLDSREGLERWLKQRPTEELRRLCERLGLLDDAEVEEDEEERAIRWGMVTTAQVASLLPPALHHSFFVWVLCDHHVSHRPQQRLIDTLPLYPTEELLFDSELLPPSSSHYTALHPLPLPKLNLQFLSLSDYLLRNFTLFRLEAAYEIREDLAYTVARIRPRLSNDGAETLFTGWSRMAVPLARFGVVAVKAAKLGETVPREVQAEVQVDLKPFTGLVRAEWEELKEFDVLFLVTVRARVGLSAMVAGGEGEDEREEDSGRRRVDDDAFIGGGGVGGDDTTDSWQRLQEEGNVIVYVRGCEVRQVIDESGKVIGERDEDGKQHHAVGSVRTYRVTLDPAQYTLDMQRVQAHPEEPEGEDVYTTFNLLIRRKAKENNFKGVLAAIRDVLQAKRRDVELPPFLREVFLGYGDVEASQYWRQTEERGRWEFVDTFLDEEHVRDSFDREVGLVRTDEEEGRVDEDEGEQQREVISSVDVSVNTSVVQASASLVRVMTRLCKPASLPPSHPPSYRLTFPLHHRPNYDALRLLTQQVRYEPAQDQDLPQRLIPSHPNLVHPAVSFAATSDAPPTSTPPSDAAAVPASAEQPPPPPELAPLLPPPPFAGVEPVFDAPHPVLHVPPVPHSQASSASSSATEESLSTLTVKVLKSQLKDLGLSQSGNKADLITRIVEHQQSEHKAHPVDAESKQHQPPPPPHTADEEIKAEVGAAERERYDQEMEAFHRAKEDFDRRLAIYHEEKARHGQMDREYSEQRAKQEQAVADYQRKPAEYQKRVGEEERREDGASSDIAMRVEVEGPSQNLPTPPVSARTRSHDPHPPPALASEENAASPPSPSAPTSASVADSSPPAPCILARRIPRVNPHAAHVRHNGVRFTPNQVEAIHSGLNLGLTLIVGAPGSGKCFARGTQLRLYNGEVIAVERIRGGELLMGDDSSPRTVVPGSIVGGRPTDRAELHLITPESSGAVPFTVNGAHILVLRNDTKPCKRSQGSAWKVLWYEVDTAGNEMQKKSKTFASEDAADADVRRRVKEWEPLLWEVSVDDYLRCAPSLRAQCRMFQSDPVTFVAPHMDSLHRVLTDVLGKEASEAQMDWAAWYLGLWLSTGRGDCESNWDSIILEELPFTDAATWREPIIRRLHVYSELFGESVKWSYERRSRSTGHRHLCFTFGRALALSITQRLLLAYRLEQHPHIPHSWLCDTLDVRRGVLAGLIDGCGFHGALALEYSLRTDYSNEVGAGCRLLALSLGVKASKVTPATAGLRASTDGQSQGGFVVGIAGDLRAVVQLCAASHAHPAGMTEEAYVEKVRDAACFGFTVEARGVGDYYGFSVRGGANQRFLLEDFTVTHNVSSHSL